MLWTYIEDDSSELAQRCIKIMQERFMSCKILNKSNITDYIDVFNCSHVKNNQKVEYYKAKILYMYGGLWLDWHTIVLQDLQYLLATLSASEKEVMASTAEIGPKKANVCMNYLLAKPKSKLFKIWTEFCEELILSGKPFDNLTIGGPAFAAMIVKDNLIDTILPFPNEITYRTGWANWEKYLTTDEVYITNELPKAKVAKIVVLYSILEESIIPNACFLSRILDLSKS
jgi:hypothetical protein